MIFAFAVRVFDYFEFAIGRYLSKQRFDAEMLAHVFSKYLLFELNIEAVDFYPKFIVWSKKSRIDNTPSPTHTWKMPRTTNAWHGSCFLSLLVRHQTRSRAQCNKYLITILPWLHKIVNLAFQID